MSIISRKPRPLKRDKNCYRDDRLFIVACDDTYAPKQYFGFFKIPRIQVHVVATPTNSNDSHAIDVLKRLKEIEHEEYDERWMLLDTDHCIQGTHLKNFTCTIKEARDAGIKVALSRPCFELWLLLHHVDCNNVTQLVNARETESLLIKTLGSYDKTQLKPEDFPIESVKIACERAKQLDQKITKRIPDKNTSRVYQLWQTINS